ncbi:DUF4214 domain-containing protein [Cellulomonas sp. McL0617]|uniref:DUF4214 domain-containing protein n=1 Tax=Cellulomonas sp. McL0617 TaxID=3415675 RepID=UPI003CF774E4
MLTQLALAALLVGGLPAALPATESVDGPPVAAAVATDQPTDAPGTGDAFDEIPLVVPAVSDAGVVKAPRSVPQDAVTADTVMNGDRVVTKTIEAADYQTVGITWAPGADAAVDNLDPSVRWRDDSGAWSAWQPMDAEDSTPDAGTPDAGRAASRGGTDPLWFGDAAALQLSFATDPASSASADLNLVLVGSPDTTAADGTAQTAGTSGAIVQPAVFSTSVVRAAASTDSESPAAVVMAGPAPTMITRAQWGAAAPVCEPDVASQLVGAAVHHTAGSNDYSTVAEAEQQIRNDQRYHIDGRGWCDIGYNFIVDKWGNLYEGRAHSLDSPVIGVHAGGFNTGTVGVAMLGTYDAVPPAATINTVAQIIGWRLAAYDVDPRGTMQYATGVGENSRFQNQTVTLPRVFGHRDVAFTACPGNGGYAALPQIRVSAATYYDARQYAESQSVVKALYTDLLGRGPDATGLTGWTAALLSGTSQSALVTALTHSDEYIALRVTKAYNEVLGRGPDPVGAQAWLTQIRAGLGTVDDVQRRFYDSDEYFATSGGTWPGYVQRLYTTMLHRGGSDAEVSTWVSLVATQGRAWVVDSIWWSREAASIRAGSYYQTFLGRGPDPTGLASWTTVLLTSGEGAVRAGIAGSQEYRARAIARFP